MSAPAEPRSLFTYLRPYKRDLAWGTFLLLVTNALDKALPWLLRHGIDYLREGNLRLVGYVSMATIAIAAIMWFVRTASRIRVFNIGRDVEYDLRNELLERVHRLGPTFFRKHATGDIMSRATNDLGQVRLLVGFGLLNVVNAIFAYVGGLALMIAISPKLTLWALSPYVLFVVLTRQFSSAMFQRSREAQESLSKLADKAQEHIAGVRIVRAFGLEEFESARFEEANQLALARNMKLVVLRGIMFPMLMGISSIGTLIAIWQGGKMVLDGVLTVGEFAAFNAYLGQLVWPTMAAGFIMSVVQRGRASYKRVREILDAKADVVEVDHPTPMVAEGHIAVRDLHYTIGDQKILDGISLTVPAKSSLAVVGRTGSGKSTFAALLPRLLPTPPNSVFVDGQDVVEAPVRTLRKNVGYAQQEPFLFSSTVIQNIAFALDDPDAPDAMARVHAAAKEAAIHTELQGLPDGYDTVVGERGVQLSGGQKQRIALARALLNEPAVLVLDDPMSAVDSRTESLILGALDRAGEGRTLILVTNRIAAASHMDSIVVMEGGKITDRGTHDELVGRDGLYARLAKRQELERELGVL